MLLENLTFDKSIQHIILKQFIFCQILQSCHLSDKQDYALSVQHASPFLQVNFLLHYRASKILHLWWASDRCMYDMFYVNSNPLIWLIYTCLKRFYYVGWIIQQFRSVTNKSSVRCYACCLSVCIKKKDCRNTQSMFWHLSHYVQSQIPDCHKFKLHIISLKSNKIVCSVASSHIL